MTSKEKKKRRNVIILSLAVVILAGLLVFVKLTNEDEEIIGESYAYNLTTLISGQFSEITYEYDDGTKVSYKYIDQEWYNADDMEFPMSTTAFENQFIAEFVALQSSRVIRDYDGGLEIFGLDEPMLTVTVKSVSDVTTVYKVGDYNQTIDEYYLMVNDDADNIYTISDTLEYICRKDVYDYATVDSFPMYSTSNLEYLQFANGNNVIKLSYSAEGREEDITGYVWNWFFEEPFTNPMPCETSKIDTFAENMTACEYSKTVNYKATDEELAEYGLDNPEESYSIYYVQEDEDGNNVRCSTTIYIGNKAQSGGYYTREVRTEGLTKNVSRVVRLISDTTQETLMGLNPLESILSNIFFLEIDDIEGTYIKFTTSENEASFSFDDGDDPDTQSDDVYTMDGVVVDSDGFKNLFYELVSLAPERLIYDKSTITDGEPVYTIFADRNVDDYYGDITIRFIKYDSNYYQVEINGATDTLIRKRDVDDFFTLVNEFIETYK